MRKDVKLGFAVGGVLLAVLIVYVSVMGRSNRPVATNQPGATVTTNAPAAPAPTVADNHPPQTTQSDPFGAQASNQQTSSTPSDAAKPADGGMDWNALLASGPVTSRTPDAASPAQPAGQTTAGQPAQGDTANVTPISSTTIRTFDPASDQAKATNIKTPATATPVTTVEPKATKTHVVAEGETLTIISNALFGSPRYVNAIAAANPGINPNRLKIGTKLNIPDVTAAKAAAPKAAESSVAGKNEYKVAQGDNLYRISVKLYGKGDRAEKIYELNKVQIGSNRAKLKLGMILKLPEAPTVASR